MKKYQYVIFDLDNTLLNFSQSEYYSLQKLFAQYGVVFNEETFEEYSRINHALWRQLEAGEVDKTTVLQQRFVRFFNQHGVKVDGAKVDDAYRHFLEERVDIMEGAAEILEYVKQKGYRILAGTNGVGRTQRIRLETSNLLSYFDALYISEEVGFEKPDVRFFDTIFTAERIKDVSQVIMIGDGLSSDIEGANRVGIDSIWMSLGNRAEEVSYTYKIDRLSDIKKYV